MPRLSWPGHLGAPPSSCGSAIPTVLRWAAARARPSLRS